MRNRDEQYTASPADAARWQAISGAGLVVPYALFHLHPYDIRRDTADVARDHARHGGLAELRRWLYPAPEGPLCTMAPGDRLSWQPGGSVLHTAGADPVVVR